MRVVAGLVLLAACGAAPSNQEAARGDPRFPPIPIGEVHSAGVPAVEVHLAGTRLRVLLDTGASQHFVLDVAATAHGVRSRAFGGGAEDGSGAAVEVREADGAALTLPGYVARHLFVVQAPALARHGLFGALSPQLLAPPEHAVVVDLPRRRVSVHPLASLASWARGSDARVCPAGTDPRDGWRYVAEVAVGRATLPLLVDTGATGTLLEIDAATDAGLIRGFALSGPPDGSASTHSASSSLEVRVIDGVALHVGGAQLRIAAGVGDRGDPTRQCGSRGVLGYDVLRRCVLVLRRDGAAMRCR